MWRNKQDCLWILNEPEVLFHLLAGAVAFPPLSNKLCVWSQLQLRSPNPAQESFPYTPTSLGPKFPLHGIHSQRNYPPNYKLPSCISYQKKQQLRGGRFAHLHLSEPLQRMVIEEESQASSDPFAHESLSAPDGIYWTLLKLTVYKLLGIEHLKQCKGNSKCY